MASCGYAPARARRPPTRAACGVGRGSTMARMTRLHLVLRGAAALALALGGFGHGTSALGSDGPAPVLVGHIDGEITPITARYVDRVVSDGESYNAAAVVFVIDTPGGLIDST